MNTSIFRIGRSSSTIKWLGGLPTIEKELCDSCTLGKHARDKFLRTIHGELIHSNLYDPMQNASLGNFYYFITYIDHFLRKCYLYFLKNKEEFF